MKIEDPVRQIIIDRAVVKLLPLLQASIGDALDNGTWKDVGVMRMTYELRFELKDLVNETMLVEQAKKLTQPNIFRRLLP